MKIAIDARMFDESGIGRYIRNLIEKLSTLDFENDYYILLRKKNYNNLVFNKNFHRVLADFRWYGLSEQIKLPKILNSIDPDIVHFPHFNVPIFYKGKFIVTIHDLIHQHFKMTRSTTHDPILYNLKQFGYSKVFKKAVTDSEIIITPSNYVKNLLITEWNVLAEKIKVTHEGVDEKILENIKNYTNISAERILGKYNITKPYIFYVGNAHPHKNVEGLVKAFSTLKKTHENLSLVLSGGDHYFWQRIRKEVSEKNIVFTNSISDEELAIFYKNAQCFIMPSFEEGFGIPLLEAMSLGCPVVSSESGSLKEIGGDAAIYFNPKNILEMVEKILIILNDEKLRNKLIEKGKKRVKEFSWSILAKQTLEVYKSCE